MKKIFAIALVLALICLSLAACQKKSDEDLILERIDIFLIAYNNGDFEGLLESMDSKSRVTLQSMSGLFGSLAGVEFGDLFGVAVGLTSESDLLSVDVIRIEIETDETASVYTEMTYSDYYHTNIQKIKFSMVKEDGEWFVKDMTDYIDLGSEN